MKKYFLLTLLITIVFSSYAQNDGFVVKGHINGFDKGFLLTIPRTPEDIQGDTVWVKNGDFEYRGKVDAPTLMWFIPMTDNPEFFAGSFNLFLGNENVTIEADIAKLRKRDDLGKITVNGSESHNEYMRLLKLFETVKPGERDKYVDLILKEKDFEKNEVMPFFVFSMTAKEDIAARDNYLNNISPTLMNNIYVKEIKETTEREKRVALGQLAPDFTLKDIHGKEYKLSDFRGKYVLFEFSASWCGWCKKEIPFLKQVYENGKDKDFVMFTINLDKNKELWQKEIETEKVPWLMLSDLQTMKGGVAKLYNIKGIPQIILIDKEGRIVKNNLRGDEMIEFLKETLK